MRFIKGRLLRILATADATDAECLFLFYKFLPHKNQ